MGFFASSGILNRRGFFGGTTAASGIVESNLVFHIDAGNASSYSGSGTTWTDISGNRNGTLTNGPTYSSADGGSISFDGSNDYVTWGTSLTDLDLTSKTIQVWFKKTGSSQRGLVDKEFDNGGASYGGWGLWTNSNNKLWWWNHAGKDLKDDGTASFSLNTWTNGCVTWNDSTKTAKFYLGGVLNSTKSDANIVEKASSTAPFLVGALRGNLAGYNFDGNISSVLCYTAVLSDSEVLQNYNALKGRYGL